GLFEMAAIPFVGCSTLAAACGMDKVTMKALFKDAGLPICDYTWFLRSDWENDPNKVTRRVQKEIGFPCFVKPANLGSSVGVSKATDKASFTAAVDLAARYDRKIIVEELVDGREIECAVIGNDQPRASLPGEYVIHEESGVPQMWEASGLSFARVIDELIELALERHRERARNDTSI